MTERFNYSFDGFNAGKMRPGMPEVPTHPIGHHGDPDVMDQIVSRLERPRTQMPASVKKRIMMETGAALHEEGQVEPAARSSIEDRLAYMARKAAGPGAVDNEGADDDFFEPRPDGNPRQRKFKDLDRKKDKKASKMTERKGNFFSRLKDNRKMTKGGEEWRSPLEGGISWIDYDLLPQGKKLIHKSQFMT